MRSKIDTSGRSTLKKEVASMIWSRDEHKDLFWAGFIAGAAAGGLLGILLATDSGRGARDQLGRVTADLKDHIEGQFRTRVSKENPQPGNDQSKVTPEQPQIDADNPI
jgi:hypothetical protein